ncbi:penicillin acylase family protein [Microbacterium sp. MPKO10]|uniref:penicillin acylase family protein n=1 Tax=Microbacterium sp. MPKO10 TaxID=2989818 RepID=UPI002236052E|nr:penicillin acylase family protein [Microbacterium sp. MPKO10]MCW4458085.1 penicillin acylase family protein [Microbacterium sp. MPKO10]
MAHSLSRRIGRVVLWIVVALLVIGLVGAGLAFWTVQRSFPTTEGTIDIPGLEHEVTVTRDAHGIPQITADSAHDLFLAQGFVQAQDRFWEMDFRRHVTSGRLSEMFGEAQVGTDTFIRTLGWRDVAEQEVAELDDTSRAYYEAYSDGVNAYLNTHSGADASLEYAVLGFQNPEYSPEPWSPADSVAWLKAMAWDLRSNLEQEIDRAVLSTTLSSRQIAKLFPPYPYDTHPTIVSEPSTQALPDDADTTPDAAADPSMLSAVAPQLEKLSDLLHGMPTLLGEAGSDIGSNSWVVSGEHTATGEPLLANDPHLGPVMPSVWYQMGLHCSTVSEDCPFDVAGYTFSGLPGVVIGHNQSIAWGFTNLGPDVADLFIEKLDTQEGTYRLDGKDVPLDVHTETITVAGGDDVEITIRSTKRGPLVSGLTGDYTAIANDASQNIETVEGESLGVSLQWTALTPGNTARAVFAMNSATDWDSFRDAARLFDVPSQNLIYADTEGNIGYQAPGRVPVRTTGDGTTPLPGWTSENSWSGYVDFDDLPRTYNPPQGYIVTANNAAVGPDYPEFITADWDAGYRAEQITERLTGLIDEGTPITADDMSSIQADNHNAIAEELVPYLLEATPSEHTLRARNLLEDWDFNDDADSAASAYFNIVWKNLLQESFAPKLPESQAPQGSARWFQVVTNLLPLDHSAWWTDDDVASRDEALARAMDSAWAEAVDLMGEDPAEWSWGDIHTLTIRNASLGESGIDLVEKLFNRGPYSVGGGSSVVNANGWDAAVGYEVNWVPSMRQVIDLSDFDASTWINLTGASGHAFHPNYVDQAPLWAAHETLPWAYTSEARADAAEHTLTLKPPQK